MSTPVLSAEEKEVEAAIQAVTDARTLQASLSAKRAKVAADQALKIDAMANAALDAEVTNDDTKYKAIQNALKALSADAVRLDQASKAAGTHLLAAEQTLHLLGVATHLKTAKRLTTARSAAAAKMVTAMADFATHYAKLNEINGRIVSSWPYGTPPVGALLHLNETEISVAVELQRLKPIVPLSGDRPLPGAAVANPYVDQTKIKPLCDVLDIANAHVLETVARGPGE